MNLKKMTRLQKILMTMEIPISRLNCTEDDKRWLLRNLGVFNSMHPDFKEAMRLLHGDNL